MAMRGTIVNSKRKALIAIAIVGFVPTSSIIFTLAMNDNEFISQSYFILCKLWIFLVPTYWFLVIEGNSVSWSEPNREGLLAASISGIIMSSIIVAMWLIFSGTIDTDSMIGEMETTGLTDFRIYVAGMFYWIFLNSMLEEYVFRWFITTKGIDLFGSELGGIALSACMFTLHHTIALHLFGFLWWQTAIASFGLLSAAAIWSWLYLRYKSIWVCWLSHAICDIAVFGIGYLVIFG